MNAAVASNTFVVRCNHHLHYFQSSDRSPIDPIDLEIDLQCKALHVFSFLPLSGLW